MAELKKAEPGQIKIEYTALPDCAQFHYATGLPQQSICGLMPQLSGHVRHK